MKTPNNKGQMTFKINDFRNSNMIAIEIIKSVIYFSFDFLIGKLMTLII